MSRNERIKEELFSELEQIERELANLEDRREELYKRIDTLNEAQRESA